jgi:enoyl-CoA hydratase/carnithine racemase
MLHQGEAGERSEADHAYHKYAVNYGEQQRAFRLVDVTNRILAATVPRRASQIASALAGHDGPVRAIIPHYAMSGGTLIALAADEIIVDPHAALGPIDPQLGEYAAASIIVAAEQAKEPEDRTLILADVEPQGHLAGGALHARALGAAHGAVPDEGGSPHTFHRHLGTHDHPLQPRDLKALGLPVEVDVPRGVHVLMRLYSQPQGRREIPASRPKN